MGTGQNIKDELDKQGKSVAWLARATGIPASTLRSAISKDRDNISIEMVYLISDKLKIPAWQLSSVIPHVPTSEIDYYAELQNASSPYFKAFQNNYRTWLLASCGYKLERITLKDGEAFILSSDGKRRSVLVDVELAEIVKESQQAAIEDAKKALEKAGV